LARQSFISAGALEGRQQELASARAAVQLAQSNVGAAEQDTLRLRAERQALAQQRGNVRLLAPGGGVVTARDAEPGTAVVAGQSVLRLVDPASLWVKVRFDQGRAADLATGQPARVVLRSRAQTPLAGRVTRLELLADAVTEERLALVSLDGGMPEGVSVGEMAEVTVQLASPPPGLLLPNASLLREAGHTGVWRLTDGGLQWVGVRAVASGLNGQVLVQAQPPAAQSTDASGSTGSARAPVPPGVAALAEGDRVVVHSPKVLRADMRVEVVKSLVPGGEVPTGGAPEAAGPAK
jgi:HlyD family secretion protein